MSARHEHLGLTAESFVHCLADHDHEPEKDRTRARKILVHDATGKVDTHDWCWVAEMALSTLDEALFGDDDDKDDVLTPVPQVFADAFDEETTWSEPSRHGPRRALAPPRESPPSYGFRSRDVERVRVRLDDKENTRRGRG